MDDLDELEWRCLERLSTAERDGLEPSELDGLAAEATCREVLSLIERCRRAEERSLYFQRQVDALQLQLDCLNAAMKESEEAESELRKVHERDWGKT